MKQKYFFLLAAFVFVLTGCQGQVSQANVDSIGQAINSAAEQQEANLTTLPDTWRDDLPLPADIQVTYQSIDAEGFGLLNYTTKKSNEQSYLDFKESITAQGWTITDESLDDLMRYAEFTKDGVLVEMEAFGPEPYVELAILVKAVQ